MQFDDYLKSRTGEYLWEAFGAGSHTARPKICIKASISNCELPYGACAPKVAFFSAWLLSAYCTCQNKLDIFYHMKPDIAILTLKIFHTMQATYYREALLLLYPTGVLPVCFLKIAQNCALSEKPVSSAIAWTGRTVSFSKFFATRIFSCKTA